MPCRIARLNYTIFHGLVLVFGTSVHVSTISSFTTFLLSFPRASFRYSIQMLWQGRIGWWKVFSQESKEEIKEKYINDRGLTNLIPSRKSKLLFYIIKYRNCFQLKLWDYQRGIKVLSSPLGRKRHRYLIARTFLIWKLSVEPRVPGWHDAKRLMGPSPSSNIFQCSLPRSLI